MSTRDNDWVQRYLDHVRHEKRLAERTLALYTEDLNKLHAFAQEAQVALDADGACMRCAIGIGAATPAPARLESARALVGSKLSDAEIRAAIAPEIGRLEIMIDHHASEAYRRRVALTLAARAVAQARDAALASGGRA